MTDTTLRDLIRECATTYTVNNPHDLAIRVAKDTPETDLERFYIEALTPYVQDVWRSERNSAIHDIRDAITPAPRSGGNESWKTSGARDAWSRFLRSKISVSGGWKPLADCSVDDLLSAIAARADHVVAVQNQIAHYERIVDAMKAEGASTVADLSEAVA